MEISGRNRYHEPDRFSVNFMFRFMALYKFFLSYFSAIRFLSSFSGIIRGKSVRLW